MNKPNGFSMIEILVTLLLLTVGILGMLALQGRTLSYTQDSIQRNTAAALANDLMELIRANPAGLPASSGFYKASGSAFPDLPNSCANTSITSSEQLACWADRASRLLPGASGLLTSDFYICRTTTPGTCASAGSAVEIQVAWTTKAGECLEGTDNSSNTNTKCFYRLRSEI